MALIFKNPSFNTSFSSFILSDSFKSSWTKIKLTIANWVLPDGTIIDENGIKPDYEVEIKEEDLKDKDAKYDPQLDRAVEILMQEIKNKAS